MNLLYLFLILSVVNDSQYVVVKNEHFTGTIYSIPIMLVGFLGNFAFYLWLLFQIQRGWDFILIIALLFCVVMLCRSVFQRTFVYPALAILGCIITPIISIFLLLDIVRVSKQFLSLP